MRVTEEYLAQKKQAIAQVAMRMYCEVGRDVSMAAICQEAGIAKGTIFRYFPSRDEMFREIYEHCRTHAEELGIVNMSPADTDEQTIRRLIRQAFVWPLDNPLEFQFVTMYTDTTSFFIFRDASFAKERFDALDSPLYASLIHRNTRPGLPAEYASRTLSALINTAARYFIAHRDSMTDDLLEQIVASIYDAVFVHDKDPEEMSGERPVRSDSHGPRPA